MFKPRRVVDLLENGQTLRVLYYSRFRNKPVGEWLNFDKNGTGKLKNRCIFSGGTKHIEEWYYENGNLKERHTFLERTLDYDGKPIHKCIEVRHENGSLNYSRNYKTERDPSLQYQEDGLDVMLYENGQTELSGEYKNGERHGVTKHFYQNGKLQSEVLYVNGRQQGLKTIYHENDEISHLISFLDGMLEGEYKVFDESGKLISKEFFVKGDKLRPKKI